MWLSRLRTRLVSVRLRVLFLASLSGLRIPCCHKLWHRSQMQLRYSVAVAVAQAEASAPIQPPSLGTSICCECSPKGQKTNKQTNKQTKKQNKKQPNNQKPHRIHVLTSGLNAVYVVRVTMENFPVVSSFVSFFLCDTSGAIGQSCTA